ncbi:4196_t:CDS:2 [Entrophospora sp. SA101]|nr:4196_t:CDS:2 [Entrophospora sp. SA101]
MKLGDEAPIITITFKLVSNLPTPVIYLSFENDFTIDCISEDESKDYVDINRPYVWTVKPNGNILLATGSIKLDITTNSSAERSMTMNLDPWSNDYNASVNNRIISTLEYRNLYYLANGTFYEFGYSKKVRKMINNPVLSYIGFRPSYTSLNYLESQIQIVDANNIYSSVEIGVNKFAVDEETEQR